MEHKWYVVRAVSGKERKVKEAIENEESSKEHDKTDVPSKLKSAKYIFTSHDDLSIMLLGYSMNNKINSLELSTSP